MTQHNNKIDDKRPFKGLLPQTRRRIVIRAAIILGLAAILTQIVIGFSNYGY